MIPTAAVVAPLYIMVSHLPAWTLPASTPTWG